MWINRKSKVLALAAGVAIASHVGLPALAAGDPRPSLSETGVAENLLGMVTQWGILLLRSKVDITYENVSTDIYSGRATIGGVTVWPSPPWDQNNECRVYADRVQVSSAELTDWDRIRMRLELVGVKANLACAPPEVGMAVVSAGMNEIQAGRIYVDADHRLSSGALTLNIHAALQNLAAISANADFPYFAIHDENAPPTFVLSRAAIEIEDQGLWQIAKGNATA